MPKKNAAAEELRKAREDYQSAAGQRARAGIDKAVATSRRNAKEAAASAATRGGRR